MKSLEGKVALITGAAGGFGRALCTAFAREGSHLFLTDKNETQLDRIVSELVKGSANAVGVPSDLTDTSQIQGLLEKAIQSFGQIDTLINNAGVCKARSIWSLMEEDWDEVLDLNVKALFFVLQATARCMRDRGGSIINIASIAGRLPRSSLLHYAASKAAVISITRSAALALASHRIRVNAVAPGMMDTPMLHALQSGLKQAEADSEIGQPSLSMIPLRRIGQPDEIASVALFLASDAAAYVTGQTLNVCGGIVMT